MKQDKKNRVRKSEERGAYRKKCNGHEKEGPTT